MIVITGAAGFIGSTLLSYLNALLPEEDYIIVDNFSIRSKDRNYKSSKWISCIDRNAFIGYFDEMHRKISFVFHLGARTDTTETDTSIFDLLNLNYSKKLWLKCVEYQIPLVYASSAATYGDGDLGYRDDHDLTEQLLPLNPYGISKNEFDKWVLRQEKFPPFWAGLKFFNVYGPNEYHKGRMASVIFHAFDQIRVNKQMDLFESYRDEYEHGEQARDFIYVRDVIRVCKFLYDKQNEVDPGIYNVGSGEARTFNDLARAVFDAMGLNPRINYIGMPEDIRGNYQYYTRAEMQKLRSQGYVEPFFSIEEGIRDYVVNYLFEKKYF